MPLQPISDAGGKVGLADNNVQAGAGGSHSIGPAAPLALISVSQLMVSGCTKKYLLHYYCQVSGIFFFF